MLSLFSSGHLARQRPVAEHLPGVRGHEGTPVTKQKKERLMALAGVLVLIAMLAAFLYAMHQWY
jgi:hypothetical protein